MLSGGKKRILYIHHGGVAGATISLLSLTQQINKKKYECFICSNQTDPLYTAVTFFSRYGHQTCMADIPKFPHTTLGSYNLKSLTGWIGFFVWLWGYKAGKKNLYALLQEVKPDIIHFNSLTLAPYAVVPFKLGIANIVHVREPVLHGICGFRKAWIQRCLNQYADRVLCICKDNMERLGLREGKATVIYNPVDLKKFDSKIDQDSARKSLNIPLDAKTVLFAGGSSPEVKGLRPFIKAMAALIQKEPNLICLMPSFQLPQDPQTRQWTIKRRIGKVIGIYRQSDALFALTRSNDLFRHIITAPFTYEMEQWVAAADVVCVPHLEPHFSRTVMEAGAMKKPVVAFRIGGVEEVVNDNETGLLVPARDVQRLTKATEHLLDNPPLRKRLGENGYAQAIKVFDANKHARSVEQIYDSLING